MKIAEALGVPAADAHDWTGDDYHCHTCLASMHCSQCASACGGQGHLVGDDDGYYFHCQEPERWAVQLEALHAKWRRRP